MSEVYEMPDWLSVSYPFDLLNDTVDRNRDWYYEQASKATKGLSFPELRIASRYALSMSFRLPQTGSKATQAKLQSYWKGVARQVKIRCQSEAQHISQAKFPMDDPNRTAYKNSLVTLTNAKLKETLAEQWALSLHPDLCTEDCVSYLQNVKDVDLEICRRVESAPTSVFGSVNESQNTTSSFVLPFRSPDDITINKKGY